ncbi:ribonuclease H-like domain-containing protein [Tanacetum coccineum]
MVNWSDHAAENKTAEVEKVYGMMAGLHSDNGGTDVSDAAAEFAMMGISPKIDNDVTKFESGRRLQNLQKLINSSMSTRTKIGLGFKEYFGKDEVFDLSTPSVFDPEPVEEDKPLYSWFVKAGEMHAVLPPSLELIPPHIKSNDFVSCDNSDKSSDSETNASCDSSLKTKTKDFPPAVDIKTLSKSDVEDPNSTSGNPSFSCLENVKSPRTNLYDPILCIEGLWILLLRPQQGDPSTDNDIDQEALFKFGVEMVENRKSTTRTSKLDFENVYYVEELQHFNLFSVSQICDKKNRVLFTDTACLVLSEEFQLPDKSGIKRDYSKVLETPQQNGVAERKNRTLIEAARTMLADSKLPTMFWTEAVSTACYVLNRVSITNPHNKTPYQLLSGKVPQIGHLKPFGCQVTILNTSDHLGKFEGKADEEDKPNVQGIGHEWYFDLDYLTDSLGYTRFKTDTPAGTQETNIPTGTQAQDSDSDVEEQVIVVPSFPSNSFAGPSSSNGPSIMERNADYAEELAKLQRQEYEAKDAAARYGYLFSQATAEILSQAETEIRNQSVSADRDPAGIGSAGGVSAGSTSVGSDPAGSHHAGHFQPAGCDDPAALGDPAVSTSVSADFIPVHADESTLPPAPAVEVNQVSYKKGEPIISLSILGDLASPFDKKQSSKIQVWVKVHSLDTLNSMIWSLFLTASRPDIMFAVSACSRHQVTPLTSHLNAVKKIFKYLKGQPKLGLWYPKDSPFQLEAYSDSDYAGSHGDRKSTTGGCQFLGRRLISWQCKKQTIVATSSTEAEYVAAASCCAQVLKIHTFNVADLLTKAFDGPRFEYLVVHIGMVDMLFCGILFSCDCRSSILLLVVILSAGRLVSAGRTMVLLVVIVSAGRLVSAGCTMFLLVVILSAGRLVSAGRTMVLLVVILSAGCSVSAGSYGFCCCFRVHDGGHTSAVVYAVITSIHAAGLVCAGGIMFLLADLFLLVVTCFYCAQLNIAGWLVYATSHLVSAGSLHSCWCHNVSAA